MLNPLCTCNLSVWMKVCCKTVANVVWQFVENDDVN